jgi:hypothetical protein
MTPPNQLRIYGNADERTWRVGDEPDPPQTSDMPWMLLAVFPIKATILEQLKGVGKFGNQD